MTTEQAQTIIRTSFESKTEKALGWNVIVHNDEVNTFDHVEKCLQKYAHCDIQKAIALAHQINDAGLAVVWQGHKERAEAIAEALKMNCLDAEIQK
jgi:ATP-dependent Clp protease adapter protein ClpS